MEIQINIRDLYSKEENQKEKRLINLQRELIDTKEELQKQKLLNANANTNTNIFKKNYNEQNLNKSHSNKNLQDIKTKSDINTFTYNYNNQITMKNDEIEKQPNPNINIKQTPSNPNKKYDGGYNDTNYEELEKEIQDSRYVKDVKDNNNNFGDSLRSQDNFDSKNNFYKSNNCLLSEKYGKNDKNRNLSKPHRENPSKYL